MEKFRLEESELEKLIIPLDEIWLEVKSELINFFEGYSD